MTECSSKAQRFTEATASFDLIVIGAGPAGSEAALTARSFGMRVLLIDEAQQAGGQYYRAPNLSVTTAPSTPEKREGDKLRAQVEAADISFWSGHRVWSVEKGFRVACATGLENKIATAPQVILATGANEVERPIPGWGRPGVVGLAAATIMMKSYKILPGKKVLVAGSGPLLYDVATRIMHNGGKVAAVVDASPMTDWLKEAHRMAMKPKLAAKGLGWMAYLAASRVKVLRGYALSKVDGDPEVTGAQLTKIDRDWSPVEGAEPLEIDCDTVCYGYGLQPSLDIPRLLGAELVYKRSRGGWTIKTDRFMRTSIKRFYTAGDVAGAFGIHLASMRGKLAAYTAARDTQFIGKKQFTLEAVPLKDSLPRAANFGRSVNRLSSPHKGLVKLITPETLVCRCESVPCGQIDDAIAEGAVTLQSLRAATRCGYGACNGRFCMGTAASIIRDRTGREPEDIGYVSARMPIRPIHVSTFTQDFSYDELGSEEPPAL